MSPLAWIFSVMLVLLSAPGNSGVPGVGEMSRIGVLCGVRCVVTGYDAFREALGQRGWVEGRNLVLPDLVHAGGLMPYGPDWLHLVVNRKAAQALGLTIPQSVLLRAAEVIR